jgi:hypothetical protein
LRHPAPAGGQGAVSHSLPGHEDLTFWTNHRGLDQIDIEGEVGFGDMARILMRRRANAGFMRTLRDRFTFPKRDMAVLAIPDAVRAELRPGEISLKGDAPRVIVVANRIYNLPLIITNAGTTPVDLDAECGNSHVRAQLKPAIAAGYFLKLQESQPGRVTRDLIIRAGGRELKTPLQIEVRPLARLRVELRDERGAPAAARVYLTASDGLAYAPRGSISRVAAMGAEYYFHAEDAFEIEVPAGQTLIEATRGPEYELTSTTVDLVPGKPAQARLRLRRWTHMAARGWYSSDAHIHANYTAPHHQVITPADSRLQATAEDLNNANMMVANSSGGFLHDEALFEGRPHSLSRPSYVLYWNEEMRNAGLYGHMCLFNLKELVRPIYTGFRDTPHWEDYPPNYTQAAAARKQGGAVTYAHPGYEASFEGSSAKELPVDLALGEIDAMDVLSNNFEPATMELYYRLLNCGFPLAISAGTDAFTNVADHYTPGGGRVYARVERPPSPVAPWYDEWIAAYKQGRSFASNGPVIELSVDGKDPGERLRFAAGSRPRVRVRAALESQLPLDSFEVLVNGKPAITRTAPPRKAVIEETLTLDGSAWIIARALGPWHRLVLNDNQTFAHTSPVYVDTGRPVTVAEDLQFYVGWIEKLIVRVEKSGRYATEERRAEVAALFRKALAIYRERLNTAR